MLSIEHQIAQKAARNGADIVMPAIANGSAMTGIMHVTAKTTDDVIGGVKINSGDNDVHGLVDKMKKAMSMTEMNTKTGFVLTGKGAEFDDPFMNPAAKAVIVNGSASAVADPSNEKIINSTDSPGKIVIVREGGDEHRPSPRQDRLRQEVSGETAQGVHLPEACAFVANLPASMPDSALQTVVEETFAKFGRCFAKVRRDVRGMPYAFVQFTETAHAKAAKQQGQVITIGGRNCRVETARVHRTLYISKRDGSSVTEAEAVDLVKPFGDREHVWIPSETDREAFDLPRGVFVRFEFFDDCRDASQKLRNDPVYKVEKKSEVFGGGSPRAGKTPKKTPPGPPSPPFHTDYFFNTTINKDYGVFVGGLVSPNINETVLRNFFSVFGMITGVRTMGTRIPGSRIGYGLIWFRNRQHAINALQADVSYLEYLNGGPVRLAPKRQSLIPSGNPRDDCYYMVPYTGGLPAPAYPPVWPQSVQVVPSQTMPNVHMGNPIYHSVSNTMMPQNHVYGNAQGNNAVIMPQMQTSAPAVATIDPATLNGHTVFTNSTGSAAGSATTGNSNADGSSDASAAHDA